MPYQAFWKRTLAVLQVGCQLSGITQQLLKRQLTRNISALGAVYARSAACARSFLDLLKACTCSSVQFIRAFLGAYCVLQAGRTDASMFLQSSAQTGGRK